MRKTLFEIVIWISPFYYIGGVFIIVGIHALWRMTRRSAPPLSEQNKFVPTPGSTPVASELDPQAEADSDAPTPPPIQRV